MGIEVAGHPPLETFEVYESGCPVISGYGRGSTQQQDLKPLQRGTSL